MTYPYQPTVFQENPYQAAWLETDYLYTGKGPRTAPNHHCKLTFEASKPFLQAPGIAIDIGCRDGEYTRYLQDGFEHTYAFDPRQRLKTFPFNVDLAKVTHFGCALGDETATIEMYGGTHDPANGKPHSVACFRLDDFGFTNVSYIKLDVEGFETKALAGAEQIIARDQPLIVVAQDAAVLTGKKPFDAKAWLEAHGYIHMATCPRGVDFVMQHKDKIPREYPEAIDVGLIQIGGLYMPETDTRFTKLGPDVRDYQRPQRDEAFKHLKTRRRALDIGANIGIFTRHFAETFDAVMAIEPLTVNIECLKRNVQDNVEILPVAVGDTMGTVKIYQTPKTLGNAFIANHNDVLVPQMKRYDESRLQDTDMITIDSLGLEDVDLMKLDIQGAELIALKGAEQTIRRCQPVVLVEEKAIGEAVEHIGQVRALLESFGMVAKERVGADRIFVFE